MTKGYVDRTYHENTQILFWTPNDETPLLYSKTGVYRFTLIFLFLLKNIDCGYSLEPPRRGGFFTKRQNNENFQM